MSWMFIVFYVFKQSLKPGEKQQTNLLIFFFLKYIHCVSPNPAVQRVG